MIKTRAALIMTQALSAAFICPSAADAVPMSRADNIKNQNVRMLPPLVKRNAYFIRVFRKRYV
jgi:hypothetical protein